MHTCFSLQRSVVAALSKPATAETELDLVSQEWWTGRLLLVALSMGMQKIPLLVVKGVFKLERVSWVERVVGLKLTVNHVYSLPCRQHHHSVRSTSSLYVCFSDQSNTSGRVIFLCICTAGDRKLLLPAPSPPHTRALLMPDVHPPPPFRVRNSRTTRTVAARLGRANGGAWCHGCTSLCHG